MFIETELSSIKETAGVKLTVGLVLAPNTANPSQRSKHLGLVLAEHGAMVRVISLPPGSPASHKNAVPAGLDVVVVDVSTKAGLGALAAIDDHPVLKTVPVVVLVERADQLSVEQYVRYGVTDFALPSVGVDELMHRLHVISARRKDLVAGEAADEALRSKVREVSAALAASPETHDAAALSQIFIEGLTGAFGADRVHLELFDEERTGLFIGQSPTCGPAGTPAPGSASPDAARLARSLWEGPRIGIFGSSSGMGNDDLPAGLVPLTSQHAVPGFTVAVPLGEAEHVSGLVQLINDIGPLPWTEVHSSLIQHVAGNFVHALHQAKLHARNAEAIERLTYLNFLKDDFVATINHEFRSPLATITGHLEMLADGLLGPIAEDRRETLNILLRNTGRLNNLVENILTVSTLNEPHPEPGPVDISDIVTTVTTSFTAAAAMKNIHLTTELPSHPVIITGHGGQLEETLRNVLRNSLDYTPDHGTIAFTLTLQPSPASRTVTDSISGNGEPGHENLEDGTNDGGPGYALITVQDTGIGIPKDDLPHLYTSFYRGSNIKRTSAPGSGLGLTITKQILDRHTGTITIDSIPGHGTTASITLPLTQRRHRH